MDTRWNNMDNGPGGDLEYFVAGELRKALGPNGAPAKPGMRTRPGMRGGAMISFLAFFLGVTLVVNSLGNVAAQIVWERDLMPRFSQDWQETDRFRQNVADCLKDFLTLGSGGTLSIYDREYWEEYDDYDIGFSEVEESIYVIQSQAVPSEGIGSIFARPSTGDSAYAIEGADGIVPARIQSKEGPDLHYQSDKNVLYIIDGGKGDDHRRYSNTDKNMSSFDLRRIDGYNFYLLFANGKARIFKDGEQLDIYGNGYYGPDSQWFIPGYENFSASKQLEGVTVYIAVRKEPIQYYAVDYETGSRYYASSMYNIAQQWQSNQDFYHTQAVILGEGLVCLALWFFLRKQRRLVDVKIASWTQRVCTEIRFIAITVCLWAMFCISGAFPEFYWGFRYAVFDNGYFTFSGMGLSLLSILLSNIPSLVILIWLIWLIHNDHLYNPKEGRRSFLKPLFRMLRARDLKRPVEKRISRMAGVSGVAVVILGAELIFFLIILTICSYFNDPSPLPIWSLWTLFLIPLSVAAVIEVRTAIHQEAVAKDIGRVADQVEAVRAGNLSKPLTLPDDADLREVAENLNDIQAGMKAALEEQTRSERMKVELVSNVSHDLKTPLTSILSYAELLRQEELSPVAADYARIIDEKAQRLKSMVQDVFEVSKAAADQLPIQLERLDLAKLLRQTLADMDGPIQKSPLTFKIDLPAEPVFITADGKRLYRVFQNLIDNALRYALEGSRVYLTLQTTAEQKESVGLAQVSVRNTSRIELPEGVDFTARFVRGDASRSDGGSGLGLSIVKSFTEACGGSFRVETVADLFTAIVTFPLDDTQNN